MITRKDYTVLAGLFVHAYTNEEYDTATVNMFLEFTAHTLEAEYANFNYEKFKAYIVKEIELKNKITKQVNDLVKELAEQS